MQSKLCYICSPYRGDIERNTEYARELTRIALDCGYTPITPHLYLTQVLSEEDPEQREKGMAAGVTEKTYKEAGELLEKIKRLESFMFWCSGKREGGRTYKWVIVKLKRKWCGGVSEEEFELTDRLKMKICQCVEEEIETLKKELEELH